MKIFPIHSSYIYSQVDYWKFLRESIEGLTHHIQQFKPKWIVLNEPPVHLSHEELIDKKIIKPMRILKAIDEEKNYIYEKALLIFPSNLKYNEGLINNFSGYDSVWVYYGNPDNTESWGVDIPSVALPDTDYIDEYKKASLFIQKYGSTKKTLLTPFNTFESPLSFSDLTKNVNNLFLFTAYPSKTVIQLSAESEFQQAPDGKIQRLYPSYYIFSALEGRLYSSDLSKKSNYRFIRTAGSGGYYTWNSVGNTAVAKFNERATDSVGLQYLIDTDFRQKRFYLVGNSILNVKSVSYISYNIDEYGSAVFTIKSVSGGGWGGTNLLNHEFFTKRENITETMFIDHKRIVKSPSKNNSEFNVTIPEYCVVFPDVLKTSTVKINLW